MTDKNHPVTWIVCILIYATSDPCVNCTMCSDTAKAYSLPVARFCSNDTVSGAPIVMDGFYADTFDDISTCKCVAEFNYKRYMYATFTYQNAFDLSPIYNTSDCGSTVTFSQPNWSETSRSCRINGTISILAYRYLEIYLTRDSTNGNRSYCFKIYTDQFDIMRVSCFEPISNTTNFANNAQNYNSLFTLQNNNTQRQYENTVNESYVTETPIENSYDEIAFNDTPQTYLNVRTVGYYENQNIFNN